uniref:CCHC-type domain-containing protein n=1 Tax=Timema tahoe TaxID=61484 RepID=A0A7R9IN82_9NEOP|nr:unnamed protein product [Timema tahoe]
MEIILRAEKIMDIINGKKQKPATTEVEEVKTWNDGNEKGMLIISTGLEYSQLQTVIACETAAQMWNRLKNVHEQRSSVNKVSLKQQFFSYRMNPNDNIAQHISTIESMALSLADVGEAVSDVDKIAKTLESLPSSFSAFISAWDSYAEAMQTFENLTSRLLREEKRLMQNDDVTTAFAALNLQKNYKSMKSQTSHNNEKRENHGKLSDKKNMKCFYCGRVGHIKKQCRNWLAKNSSGSNPDESKHVALSAEYKNVSASGCETVWLADSAASKHMTYHKEWFSPRPHEAGGKYAKGVIVRHYKEGSLIKIRVELTANHRGYFEFRLCPNNRPKKIGTQECLDKYVLSRASQKDELKETRYYPELGNKIFEIKYLLPIGLTCTQCILQWRYIAGNNWGTCVNGTGAVGCGPQEEFRACADVAIVNASGLTNDTSFEDERDNEIPTNSSSGAIAVSPSPTLGTRRTRRSYRRGLSRHTVPNGLQLVLSRGQNPLLMDCSWF